MVLFPHAFPEIRAPRRRSTCTASIDPGNVTRPSSTAVAVGLSLESRASIADFDAVVRAGTVAADGSWFGDGGISGVLRLSSSQQGREGSAQGYYPVLGAGDVPMNRIVNAVTLGLGDGWIATISSKAAATTGTADRAEVGGLMPGRIVGE